MMHDAYHHKIFILKALLYLDKRDNNIIQIVFTAQCFRTNVRARIFLIFIIY